MKSRNQLTVLIVFEVAICALLCSIISVVAFYAALAPDTFSLVSATLAPTLTPPPPKIVVASPTPITVVPKGSPTPDTINYKVATGDTLWGIAAKFNITLEAIITSNPGINPDKLLVGQTLIIPVSGRALEAATPSEGSVSVVAPEVAALRLRRGPSDGESVLMMLAPNTSIKVVGRTSDSLWLEVIAPNNQKGWVSTQWVRTQLTIANVPVTGQTILVTATAIVVAPRPTTVANATVPPPQSSEKYPFISGITNTSHQIFINGRNAGNRTNVFSKVGDSITISGAFLNGFGINKYNLRDYQQDLEPVVKFYSQETARNSNSFANTSLAADTGWSTASIFVAGNSNKTLCNANETPLVCEYRNVRPAVAIIMLGTNDVPGIQTGVFERNMRLIIEITTQMGIVPIISTIPPMLNRSDANRVPIFNTIIKALAREYDIPLLDYWAALQPLPNFGIANDGVHPTFSQQYSADFTPDAMLYGMTIRNLTALQALDAVWRNVLK